MNSKSYEYFALLAFNFISHDRFEQATVVLEAMHQLWPTRLEAMESLAYCYVQTDQLDSAQRMIEQSRQASSGFNLDLIEMRIEQKRIQSGQHSHSGNPVTTKSKINL